MTLEERYGELSRTQIQKWIEEQRGEDLHLDFKQTRDESLAKAGTRKMLAKAISGFANSDGGLIVWGVGTETDRKTGTDYASAEAPLSDAKSFCSRLHELTGEAVSPTVDGVDHRFLRSGFAVTLVPASDSGPHMAKFGLDRYYKRSGSSVYRMEHFDVADMFGRRPSPDLSVWLGDFKWTGDVFSFPVGIENSGRGSAIAPSLMLKPHPPLYAEKYRSNELPGRVTTEPGWRLHASSRNVVLHPHGRIVVAYFCVNLAGDYKSLYRFRLDFRVIAEGVPLRTGTIEENFPGT